MPVNRLLPAHGIYMSLATRRGGARAFLRDDAAAAPVVDDLKGVRINGYNEKPVHRAIGLCCHRRHPNGKDAEEKNCKAHRFRPMIVSAKQPTQPCA